MDIKGPATGSKYKKASEVKISLLFVSPPEKKKSQVYRIFSNNFLYFHLLRVMVFCSNLPVNFFRWLTRFVFYATFHTSIYIGWIQPIRLKLILNMNFQVFKQLVEKTKSTPGAKVENNKFCVSVHFRCVDEKVLQQSQSLFVIICFTVYVHLIVFSHVFMPKWGKKIKKKQKRESDSAWKCRNGVNWPNKLNQ